MNRNIIIIVFIVIFVGAISLLYYYVKLYSPEYSWVENYKKESAQPYGLKVFYDLLDGGENEIINIKKEFNEALDTTASNTNYVAFGEYLYIDSLRSDHILKYVENGNNAFIVSNSAPLNITRMFLTTQDSIYDYKFLLDSLVSISFANNEKQLSFHHQFLKDTTSYYWSIYYKSYFNDTFSDSGFEAISYLNGEVNCYSFNWGKGKIIIHSNPILFTNYNIIQKDGFTNTNHMLSYLNNGTIYWDEASQKPSFNLNSGNGMPSGNPLQFLFSHYTLRWGWYLFLITILVYLMFRTKREQRIIPILQKNTNTTIEYTKAVGVLYFQKGQHKLIANEMYVLLMASLRSRYGIITTTEEPELINNVVTKSGIDEETITSLFKHFRKVRYSPMANSKDLINLHTAVELYYKNCN